MKYHLQWISIFLFMSFSIAGCKWDIVPRSTEDESKAVLLAVLNAFEDTISDGTMSGGPVWYTYDYLDADRQFTCEFAITEDTELEMTQRFRNYHLPDLEGYIVWGELGIGSPSVFNDQTVDVSMNGELFIRTPHVNSIVWYWYIDALRMQGAVAGGRISTGTVTFPEDLFAPTFEISDWDLESVWITNLNRMLDLKDAVVQ